MIPHGLHTLTFLFFVYSVPVAKSALPTSMAMSVGVGFDRCLVVRSILVLLTCKDTVDWQKNDNELSDFDCHVHIHLKSIKTNQSCALYMTKYCPSREHVSER